MISFIVCLLILVCGYFTYGKFVDNTFGPDDRETPAVAINDGVDYVVMPPCRARCGDRSYSCGSRSVRFLPVRYMITSPVCFPREMTVLRSPK